MLAELTGGLRGILVRSDRQLLRLLHARKKRKGFAVKDILLLHALIHLGPSRRLGLRFSLLQDGLVDNW